MHLRARDFAVFHTLSKGFVKLARGYRIKLFLCFNNHEHAASCFWLMSLKLLAFNDWLKISYTQMVRILQSKLIDIEGGGY
jgi:hypothetical protein